MKYLTITIMLINVLDFFLKIEIAKDMLMHANPISVQTFDDSEMLFNTDIYMIYSLHIW